jgi:hypothetical protein
MSGATLNMLTRRLDRLERENRRLKLTVALGVLVLAAVALMGQAKSPAVSKVVEAEQFVLRDAGGLIRGRWVAQDNGFVALEFISQAEFARPRGARRMMLFNAIDDSVGLMILNRPGDPVAVLEGDAKGVAALKLYDYDRRRKVKGQMPMAALEMDDGGLPALYLYDGSGQASATLTIKEYISGSRILYDPELVFRDRTGTEHRLWKAP